MAEAISDCGLRIEEQPTWILTTWNLKPGTWNLHEP